jgi:uncharacterized repeat protein (TIGR02543 family)
MTVADKVYDEETIMEVGISSELTGKTWYVDGSGGADFTTIQAAVIAADAGDTIIAQDGTYNENVTVDKSLTIRSENGASSTTVIAVATTKPVFDIDASGVVLDGFSVLGPTGNHVAGIELVGVNDCTIQNNECSGECYNGIHLGGSAANNTVTGNYCHGNYKRGISIRDTAHDNFIINNTVENNAEAGFCIKDQSKDNVLWLNNIIGNPVEILTENAYHSPDPLNYTYKGYSYTGYLGNYWENYAGVDADGNGVGDIPHNFGAGKKDDYPLMGQWRDGVIAAPEAEFPYIISITGVDSVEVPIGTVEADAIAALASETTITDSDDETYTVALDWTIAEYDGNTPGDYTATGTFELPEGVEQSDPPLELKVTATVTVLAQAKYAVTLAVDPAAGGSASGAGAYAEGESVTVEAQAAEGYVFVNWTDAEGEVSTEASYTFTMPAEAVSLTANFEKVALEITGEGVTNPVKFTMTQLEGMGQYRHLYSTINTYPTKKWYVAEGVKLRDLLELAEITGDAKQLRFVSRDGFKATFTVKELLDDTRYLFPHFKDNDEYAGYIPGSPEDAEPVETILALRSCEGTNFDNMNTALPCT